VILQENDPYRAPSFSLSNRILRAIMGYGPFAFVQNQSTAFFDHLILWAWQLLAMVQLSAQVQLLQRISPRIL